MKSDRGVEVQLYSIFNIGSRCERVVLSPGRLATGQRKDNHCIGNWIVSRAGLDGTERLKHKRFRSSDLPVRSESLYLLHYPDPYTFHYIFEILFGLLVCLYWYWLLLIVSS